MASQSLRMPKRVKATTESKPKKTKLLTTYKYQDSKSTKNVSIASNSRYLKGNYFKTHRGAYPQRYTTTMRLSSTKQGLIPAASYNEPLVITLNTGYDPTNVGGGSVYPAGWLSLIAQYTKCYVRAARLRVQIANLSEDQSVVPYIAVPWGITITTNTTNLGSFRHAMESGLVTNRLINASPDVITLTQNVDVGKFCSVDDLMDGSGFFCTATGDPSQIVCAHVWAYNNNASSAANYFITYTIDFDCIFADPVITVA